MNCKEMWLEAVETFLMSSPIIHFQGMVKATEISVRGKRNVNH
jgi:hypothetical protein